MDEWGRSHRKFQLDIDNWDKDIFLSIVPQTENIVSICFRYMQLLTDTPLGVQTDQVHFKIHSLNIHTFPS